MGGKNKVEEIVKLDTHEINHNPQILKVYLYYRLCLSVILYLMFEARIAENILGVELPLVFTLTSILYIAVNIGSLFIFKPEELKHSVNRVTSLLTTDLIAILAIVFSSGGPQSGLGYLLLINTAMASFFLRGRFALGFASVTAIFVITQAIFQTQLSIKDHPESLFSAGTLGILIFVTALTFNYLTERIHQSNIFASEKAQYAEHLEKLAKLIVTRMRTGIIVINHNNRIELINDSALQLLDLPQSSNYIQTPIDDLANINSLFQKWKQHPITGIPKVHQIRDEQEVKINFSKLETGMEERTLMYIEDYRAITQQAQQLKLASLGRLTASIAHEVRNPLGAISHASQLLEESNDLSSADKRLTQIILQHSDRVNQIIENTMVLSRRKEPNTQLIQLDKWTQTFIKEYQTHNPSEIKLSITEHTILTKFDATQLTQVVTNLVDNGLRHGKQKTGVSKIEIHCGLSDNAGTAYMEIIDFGKGVDEQYLSNIFEPFFTTEEKGTGLGLYICKELCEINQATLHYKRNNNLSCFRINFPHHQRMV